MLWGHCRGDVMKRSIKNKDVDYDWKQHAWIKCMESHKKRREYIKRMKKNGNKGGIFETIKQYLMRGGVITKCPPYINDTQMHHSIPTSNSDNRLGYKITSVEYMEILC